MNIIKKFLKVISLFIILVVSNHFSNASFVIDNANLYSKGEYVNLLTYNGIEVLTTFVVYYKDEVEYPAYCLDKEKKGINELDSYNVTVEGAINNSLLWRVIKNGFPYKTAYELGCSNDVEAFVATKQAVYCILYGNDYNNFERYNAIGEAGQRTLNALKQIVTKAKNANTSIPSSNISTTAENDNWEIDSRENNCISKTFKLTSGGAIAEYTIKKEGNFPKNTRITNIYNKEVPLFSGDESFKILIPIQNLKENGKFTLKVEGEVNTSPILYGKASNSGFQDYALTGEMIEIGNGDKEINYYKNNTKVIIEKVDKDTKAPLKGAEFKVLDSNQKDIYSGLMTNEEGKIFLENLLPGKYYIEETSTIEGYEIYEEQIEIEVEMNEEFILTVNNAKTEEPEVIKKISQEKKEVSFLNEKLPKAGM